MYINEQEVKNEDGVKKIINEDFKETENIADWRKSCNKKYRNTDDDI